MSTLPLMQRIQSKLSYFVFSNLHFVIFFGILTYFLFLANWVMTTDWITKFHWISVAVCAAGLLYLHRVDATLILEAEAIFFTTWVAFLFYHYSTWKNNYDKVAVELSKTPLTASLRKYQGSIFRYLITLPTTKNASNQWNAPSFGNFIHILLMCGYMALLALHITPFFTPFHCITDPSPLCCRYNYAMQGFDSHEVNPDFCSGRVRIAFTGSWSTGKTYLISALLGHNYSTAQSAPAPTTDNFVCLSLGAPYSGPIRSDDFDRRRHCEIMTHINDVTLKTCESDLSNVKYLADTNTEFDNFVFLDIPGYQREYGEDCKYRTFYSQLIDKVDFSFVVWDVNHGMIEDEFADMFRKNKARGIHYEIVYNRFTEGSVDMAFLNQQHSKMTTGKELLSEMFTMKLHENSSAYANEFHDDVLLLRAKIKSVNQTVRDNRKMKMKENLLEHVDLITGFSSLRKIKIAERLINDDLNVYKRPKTSPLRLLGIEL